MKKRTLLVVTLIILALLAGVFYFLSNSAEQAQIKTEIQNQVVSDSIKNARSEEIKAALRNGSDQLSAIDYAFIASEIGELSSEDTLFYAFNPYQSSLPEIISDSIFFSADLVQHQLEHPDSKYIYWSLANAGPAMGYGQHISEIIGLQQVRALLSDSSDVEVAGTLPYELFEASDKIDIKDIPEQFFTYDFTSLEEDIKNRAFSEVVGEDEVMDFLIKDPENTLKIIEGDSLLTSSFNNWLNGLDTPDGWLYFSEDYPAEIHARKLDYLISELKKSQHPFAEKTWKALDKVEIVELD